MGFPGFRFAEKDFCFFLNITARQPYKKSPTGVKWLGRGDDKDVVLWGFGAEDFYGSWYDLRGGPRASEW